MLARPVKATIEQQSQEIGSQRGAPKYGIGGPASRSLYLLSLEENEHLTLAVQVQFA